MTIKNAKKFKNILLLIIVLVVAGSFVYAFNLNNQLFWDDDDWIINNTFVQSINWDNIKFWFTNNTLAGVGLTSNYYRPFLFFTFALNYVLSGIEPLTYHLFSNAIHIFNGILVFWLIRLAFRRNLLAFLVALLFLIHPLQTEAVTYISGRGDVLAAMFMLLTLLLWIINLTYQSADNRHVRSTTLWLLSLVTLVFALLSRETAIIFPVLALVYYVSIFSHSTDSRQANDKFVKSVKTGLIKTWPYVAVVVIYGILRLTVLNFQNTLNFYTEPNIYSENLHIRILTFLPILWGYFKLLIVPIGLHMERSAVVYTSLFQWPVWPVAVTIVTLLYYLVVMYKKGRFNNVTVQSFNNSQFQIWLFGTLWFFIALAPVSGITPINALVYEHWLYLPMVGFWLIISFYLVKLFDYLSRSLASGERSKASVTGLWLWSLVAGLIIYFSFLSYQSIQRNILWGKHIEFYKDILKYQPNSLKINNNLGNLYLSQGDTDKAEIYYRKAIDTGDVFGQPYYNLGRILQTRGDLSGAIQLYQKAIEIDPGFHYAYQNLAVIYAQQGNLTKAAENIEKLKKLLPQNPRVYYNSALVYLALKNKSQALDDLKTGLKYIRLDSETGKLIEELIQKLE